jgi:hypothetical protein
MGCGHEDAMHTLKKRFENRRSGGQCVSPTALGATTPCADTPRGEPVSVAGDAERSMPDSRRKVAGRSGGQ